MTSSTTLLQSAVSPDGSVVAIVAPSASSSSSRHVIQIYQVSDTSTSLQLTLTHTSNQSLAQLVFVGKSLVLGRLGHHEVVVWDLHRGVVATKLLAADDQSFLAVASNAASDDRYYILVRNGPKLYIQEYQVANHKLVRKIKSGHLHEGEVDAGMEDVESKPTLATMVVTPSHLAVRTRDSGIRIMAQDTGKKVGKIKIKSLNGIETALDMAVCEGNPNTLAVVQEAGNATTVLYDMSSCKEVVRISPKKATSSNDNECHLQLVVASESNDQRYTLLRKNVLLSVDASTSSHELLTQLSSDHPVALFLRKTKVLALMYQRGAECQARWVSHGEDESSSSSLPAVVALDQELEHHDQQQSDRAGTKKRKPTETTVLGPGQAGTETASSVKKVRVNEGNDDEEMGKDEDDVDDEDDDENDEGQNMTIAERLAMLKEALDEDADDGDDDDHVDEDEEGVDFVASDKTTISFKPKRATTESLKELLSQALQSSEDNLLELALMVRDVKIIATTLKELDGELLVILLGKLTSRLASSPLRAESLSVWISHCLKRGTFHPEHLAVLRNLLYERIESFSDLLRLEGRLSMMVD
ncbi:hypothetical protein IV203_008705 [Nitzschia inconspicua]|uniref:Small-subunit processome Utp12 domain-containing protein n=1 Tax=Nitzschia inconspicua TaxID=303405 RepID=A0A9K3KZT6_9STRA|nr:hypothetical protein IV203_008705 [Nitzschia inconspicua]